MKTNVSVTVTKLKKKEFENSIHNRNDAYNVELPWHEDKIKTFPFNYPVAFKVVEKKLIITLKVKI